MKFILTLLFVFSAAIGFAQHDDHSVSEEPVGVAVEGGVLYGSASASDMKVVTFEDLMTNPSAYDGQTLTVSGSVSDVCQKMGCWMIMSSGNNKVRVTTAHEFFVPKDKSGSVAEVYGTFKIKEISEERAKHYNDESKNPDVKTEDIKGPQKTYEILATGIKFITAK